MKFPFWLPKPRRHWLRSIELLLLSVPVVFILRISGNLVIISSLLDSLTKGQPPSSLISVFWLGFFFVFPPFFFAHTYQLLHDDPREDFPVWFPRWRCWINGWAYWVIYLFAILISFLIWLDFEVITGTSSMTEERYIEKIMPLFIITWIISAAYLFYLKDGIAWFLRECRKLVYALIGKKPN